MRRLLWAAVGGAALVALVDWRRRCRRVNRSIPVFARYWERGAHSAAPGALQFVVLGDSSCQGIGASHPGEAWPQLVADWIEERTGRPVTLHNFSVSGSITSEVVRDQLPRLLGLGFVPDLVAVCVGGNDATQLRRVPARAYRAAFRELCARLPTGSFVADPPAFTPFPLLRARSLRLAGFARGQIRAKSHHLLPLHALTARARGLTYFRYTAADCFHANERGYYEWAAAFFGALLESGWEERILREAMTAREESR